MKETIPGGLVKAVMHWAGTQKQNSLTAVEWEEQQMVPHVFTEYLIQSITWLTDERFNF